MKIGRSQRVCCIALGVVLCQVSAAEDRMCALVRKGADFSYMVTPVWNAEHVWRSTEFDFDHDGQKDEMSLECGDGSSFVPSDPCDLALSLATGSVVRFRASFVQINRLDDRFYVVAGEPKELPGIDRAILAVYAVRGGALYKLCGGIAKDHKVAR